MPIVIIESTATSAAIITGRRKMFAMRVDALELAMAVNAAGKAEFRPRLCQRACGIDVEQTVSFILAALLPRGTD